MDVLTYTKGRNQVVAMITPDYLKSKAHSMSLAKRVEEVWHRKGYKQVKAWVETISQANGEKYFVVRSNISFTVPARD